MVRSASFRSNKYFTHRNGVLKIENTTRGLRQTGAPRGLALDYGINEILNVEDIEYIAGIPNLAISTLASRDEDTFENIIPKDQLVTVRTTGDTTELTFEEPFAVTGLAQTNELSISFDSGLGGVPGTYPVLNVNTNTITLPLGVTDFPMVDYEIRPGELTLTADPDNDDNIIIVIPDTEAAPSKDLENKQMLIPAGALGNDDDVVLDVLKVDGHQITIENALNLRPTEAIIPAGDSFKVELFPDDDKASFYGDDRFGADNEHRQIILPQDFLGITSDLILDSEATPMATNRAPNEPIITVNSELLADNDADLRAGTDNTVKLKAGERFHTFTNRNHVYIGVPTNPKSPLLEVTEDTSPADLSKESIISIPAGAVPTSNFGSTTPVTKNVALPISTISTSPRITNGQDTRFTDVVDTNLTWLGITQRYLEDDEPLVNWGVLQSHQKTNQNRTNPNHYQLYVQYPTQIIDVGDRVREKFNAFNRSFDLAIPPLSRSSNTATVGDWVIIPQSVFFTKRTDYYNSVSFTGILSVLPPYLVYGGTIWETPKGNPLCVGPIIEFSTYTDPNRGLAGHDMYTFDVPEKTREREQQHSSYQNLRYPTEFNDAEIKIIRLDGTLIPQEDITIQVRPTNTYITPVDIKIKYTDRVQNLVNTIQIGTFNGEKRLTKDLYLYDTAKSAISTDDVRQAMIEIFTLTSDRIRSFQLITLPNSEKVLTLQLITPLSPQEEQYLLDGNLNSGTFDIPSNVTFLGISDVSLEYAGISRDFFNLVIPTDLEATVEAAIAAHTPGTPIFDNPINFQREGFGGESAVKIKTVTSNESLQEVRLEYELISSDELLMQLQDVLENAKQILVPLNQTFLGIEGVELININKFTPQTETEGIIIAIDASDYNLNGLVRAVDNTTSYIFGDFTVGGIGDISATGDEVPGALKQDGQYSYKIVWSYEDENNNLIVGEPSESLIVTTHPNTPNTCLLYTSPSPRDRQKSRMPSSA